VTLPHYSFAYYKFSPSSATSTLNLSMTKSSGIQTAVFKKAGGTISEITADAGTNTYSVSGFGTLSKPWGDEVVLLVANTSSADSQSVNFGTTGSGVQDVTVTSGNGTITSRIDLPLDDPVLSLPAKPSGFTPTSAINFTATVASGNSVTVQLANLTLPATPVFYKVVGTLWTKLEPADFTLSGTTLTFAVEDNGRFDSDSRVGFIQDPLVVGTATASSPPPAAASGGGGGGGCFIATAAYGSYLHPKVAELRMFRDRYLLTNGPGRLFVSLYYRLSPPVARVIAEHEWMRAGVRVMLVPLVLTVEHPSLALLVLCLALSAGLALRLTRPRHKVFTKSAKFIHLA